MNAFRYGLISALQAIVVFVAIACCASTVRADEAPSFSERVDLEPLGTIAVYGEGRLKSLGSHANSMMQFVTGPRKIAGQDSLFTYIDLMLRPEAYVDADLVYVKNRSVREAIARELERLAAADPTLAPDMAERMNAFRATGLTSPRFLHNAALEPLFSKLEADVIRTARPVSEIRSALAVAEPGFLLGKLMIVPPASKSTDDQWHSVGELMLVPGATTPPAALTRLVPSNGGMDPTAGIPGIDSALQGQIADAWRAFVNAWLAQDADGVRTASASLATLLPKVAEGSDLYPEQSRLAWESWYFHMDQLTSIWLVYMLSVVFLLLGLIYRWTWARRLGVGVFVVAFGLQTFALLLRWYISDRWPNSNMFEAVTTAAWFGGCAAMAIELFVRRTPMKSLFFLGSAAASMVALMTAHFLPVYLNPNISNMMPVLHDVWLYIHTNVIIFSYVLIFMAAVSAFCYLAWRMVGGTAAYARVGGAGMLVLEPGSKRARAGEAPSIGEVLDGVTMVLMELSFVLLWAGIVMGAIWADHSWGRPWGWDPKEVFALNTFVVFALLVHVRLKVVDKGLWTAILALGGAAVMLFNWIVINFVITGLHSYA
ncbi:MAG: cytochrome c biogenesis protein CcsA [Phycisphaerae bacterium]|nr:cytochrome c biogenesis protein CcsA [Phycisphaerae bacterium]